MRPLRGSLTPPQFSDSRIVLRRNWFTSRGRDECCVFSPPSVQTRHRSSFFFFFFLFFPFLFSLLPLLLLLFHVTFSCTASFFPSLVSLTSLSLPTTAILFFCNASRDLPHAIRVHVTLAFTFRHFIDRISIRLLEREKKKYQRGYYWNCTSWSCTLRFRARKF